MKAKIYIGAKKYALYIGSKIVEKTLEFLSLPARFISNKVQELKNLTMWGDSVQNGTPTPTTPVDIESVGDKTKNLFDGISIKGHVSSEVLGSDFGIITTSKKWVTKNPIKIKPNTTYSLKILNLPTFATFIKLNRLEYDKNLKLVVADTTNTTNKIFVNGATFTTSSNSEYVVFSSFGDNITDENKAIQVGNSFIIVEGDEIPTSYEPYGYKIPVETDDTTTNIYLNEPLRKIGDYTDTMSVNGTTVTVVRNVGNKIFNGTENYWTIASSGGNNYFSFLKTDIGTNSTILPTGSKDAISSRFDNSYGRVDLKFSVGGNYINFVYDALNYDIPTWTNWLSNNNIEFIYPHSTPTTETYTIEQPINLPQGTLTIDTNTNIKPTKINITGDIDNE